jgi:hypothetical protein
LGRRAEKGLGGSRGSRVREIEKKIVHVGERTRYIYDTGQDDLWKSEVGCMFSDRENKLTRAFCWRRK